MTLEQIVSDINRELRAQLEKYHCVRGQLRYQAPSMVSLNGTRGDGKPVLIWQNAPRLPYLLSLYVDQLSGCGGVTVEVDLSTDRFEYKPLSIAVIKQEAKEQEEQESADEKRRQQAYRRSLEQQTETYGMALASAVADALLHNSIGYGHRDYCGTGLEYRDGVYYYGELMDGFMWEPFLQWASKQDFIQWLARQSDASLARLEAKEPFYWGNQTITRNRLTELLNAKR
ncbi:hypothetical protein [Longitalea luteola]|uniref:hypothetical protein n=1 Tax=Longitalea luteola TaxID=2812563 RepID=UPI001A97A334|nr:hypothetical protein [Longitalea luteola]